MNSSSTFRIENYKCPWTRIMSKKDNYGLFTSEDDKEIFKEA